MERKQVRDGSGSEGFTLLEVTVVLAITTFLISIVANLVTSSGDSQAYAQRMARGTEINQELINELRGELLSSVGLLAVVERVKLTVTFRY